MEEHYARRTKNSLVNARNELKNILNILDDGISINNNAIKSNELRKVSSNINNQINSVAYYIIPAIREYKERHELF